MTIEYVQISGFSKMLQSQIVMLNLGWREYKIPLFRWTIANEKYKIYMRCFIWHVAAGKVKKLYKHISLSIVNLAP